MGYLAAEGGCEARNSTNENCFCGAPLGGGEFNLSVVMNFCKSADSMIKKALRIRSA